jgi:hypothetical protein
LFRDYFSSLYDASSQFIRGLALAAEASSLDMLLGPTRGVIEERRPEIVAGFNHLRGRLRRSKERAPAAPAGLNTVGMLCDRLTVLAMKQWVLEHRSRRPADAGHLRDTQVAELLDALDRVVPGHSSYTQKVTTIDVDAAAQTWEEAYFGLLSTNVLLWESQEVLYGGRIDRLPCEELRRYIGWFSEGNIRRNLFIARCEPMFWHAAGEADAG